MSGKLGGAASANGTANVDTRARGRDLRNDMRASGNAVTGWKFCASGRWAAEQKNATPPFLQQAMAEAITSPIAASGASSGLAAYPATAGDPALRRSFTDWLKRRYDLALDPATQVLPVNGSREALFAFAQTVI